MFYTPKTDKALRFGDVITGFILAYPLIDEPILIDQKNYKIDIKEPIFSVILTPCCSIRDEQITLTPLIELDYDLFKNTYLLEDFTRINREMSYKQGIPSKHWEALNENQKAEYLMADDNYIFVNLFVYEKNDLFQKYKVKTKDDEIITNYYMIDFRNTCKIDCKKIITPKNSPTYSKQLQLSLQSREDLRNKIAHFYTRIPEEDNV